LDGSPQGELARRAGNDSEVVAVPLFYTRELKSFSLEKLVAGLPVGN
jgi:hypothetical protein